MLLYIYSGIISSTSSSRKRSRRESMSSRKEKKETSSSSSFRESLLPRSSRTSNWLQCGNIARETISDKWP